MTDKKTSPDEISKKQLADGIVQQKAIYFVPKHSVSVEADDVDDSVKKAEKLTTKEEEGDE